MYYFINVFFCGHKLFNVSNFCAAAGATVVLAQPMIGPLQREATRMVCPHCSADITTTTSSSPSMMAYATSAILCFMG